MNTNRFQCRLITTARTTTKELKSRNRPKRRLLTYPNKLLTTELKPKNRKTNRSENAANVRQIYPGNFFVLNYLAVCLFILRSNVIAEVRSSRPWAKLGVRITSRAARTDAADRCKTSDSSKKKVEAKKFAIYLVVSSLSLAFLISPSFRRLSLGQLYCEECYGKYLAPDCEKCRKKILGVSRVCF